MMKKTLKKRETRGQKNLQVYGCSCNCTGCSGCGSVPSYDYLNMISNHNASNTNADIKKHS